MPILRELETIPLDEATKLQVCLVMLLKGTHEQQCEATKWLRRKLPHLVKQHAE